MSQDKRRAILKDLLYKTPCGEFDDKIIDKALTELDKLELTEEEIEKIIMKTQAKILLEHGVPATNSDLSTAIFKAQEEKKG